MTRTAFEEGVPFVRVQSCGNDFLLVDNRRGRLASNAHDLARYVCRRGISEGADGLLLAERGEGNTEIRMRLINADGSEGEMCGNGAIAFSRVAVERFGVPSSFTLQTLGGDVAASVMGDEVKVTLRALSPAIELRTLRAEGERVDVAYLEVYKVPHVVVRLSERTQVSEAANRLGSALCHHPAFSRGANVNFAFISAPDLLEVRTFERGVDAQTLSCGTGSIASFLALRSVAKLSDHVEVQTPGGALKIRASGLVDAPDIGMKGRPRVISEGILLKDAWAT